MNVKDKELFDKALDDLGYLYFKYVMKKKECYGGVTLDSGDLYIKWSEPQGSEPWTFIEHKECVNADDLLDASPRFEFSRRVYYT